LAKAWSKKLSDLTELTAKALGGAPHGEPSAAARLTGELAAKFRGLAAEDRIGLLPVAVSALAKWEKGQNPGAAEQLAAQLGWSTRWSPLAQALSVRSQGDARRLEQLAAENRWAAELVLRALERRRAAARAAPDLG
jgi:hypothetical protein